MPYWNSIARMFPGFFHAAAGKLARRFSAEAELRKAGAYRAVFEGNGGREDAEIVLADLAAYTGFFRYSPGDTPAELLRQREGMREVFAYIHGFLTLTAEQTRALQDAARAEAAAEREGQDE